MSDPFAGKWGLPRVLCLCVGVCVCVWVCAAAAGGGSQWQRVNNLRTNNFGKYPKQREQPEKSQKTLLMPNTASLAPGQLPLLSDRTARPSAASPFLHDSLPFPLAYTAYKYIYIYAAMSHCCWACYGCCGILFSTYETSENERK